MMQDNTIWNEQICAGFINKMKGHIRVNGRNGRLVEVENITVKKPEISSGIELLPAVTIQNYDIRRAIPNQMGSSPSYENYDTENGTVEYTQQPIKFWLYYQIDFWSEYQEDMDNMMFSWIRIMPDKGGKLEVKLLDGTDTTVLCSLIGVTSLDGTDSDKRLFRKSFSYRVSGMVDTSSEVRKYITTVNIEKDLEV